MRKLAWVATWVAAVCLVAGCAARVQTGKPAADQRKPQKAAAGGEERGKPEQTPLSQKAKQPLAQSQKYKLGNREQEAKAMVKKGATLYLLKRYGEARKAFEQAAQRGHAGARRALEILRQEGH